jgi:2-methylcitrate dehydratase PrpD
METTLALARRIAGRPSDELPQEAFEVGKQALLDYLGVTLAGMNEPLSRILRAQATEAGGHSQASVLGTPQQLSLEQAALINGAAGHAHDYDDVHNAMSGHPTVPVAPAVLALAEYRRASGAQLLDAFCTGVDVECILGRYAGPGHYAHGWHNTGTLGTFGAAAAAARLYQLDTEATLRALGIAGTQAAGLKSQFGSMCKPLHAGRAAATGLQSADLARLGFGSCPDILENPQGFMATQSDTASVDRFVAALAVPSYTQDICFKYHAACYLTHSAIEATRTLCERNKFDPTKIRRIEVEVDKGHLRVCNIPAPATGLEAKFSLRLTTAMALTGTDTSSIAIFDDALVHDPQLISYRDRVEVKAHAAPNPDTIVRIITEDGASFEAACNVAIPMRDLDAQWRKLIRKFRTLATPVLGSENADFVIATCRNLDQTDDLQPLFRTLRRDS